jgi:DNA-binding NarL/FixJ family response regulator
MKTRTALIAHPYPIVVEALASIVAGAGFAVTRAGDAAATLTGLEAVPDLAVVAVSFGGAHAARAGSDETATLVIADRDGDADGVIALTTPVARLAAAIAVVAGAPRAVVTPALTPRERDVARLVAAGQRNRAIATTLGISEGTVKMHLHNVYAKLGLESRTQLAMSAGALGAR